MRHRLRESVCIYLLLSLLATVLELLTFVERAGFLARKLLCHPQNNEQLRMLCHPQSCVL